VSCAGEPDARFRAARLFNCYKTVIHTCRKWISFSDAVDKQEASMLRVYLPQAPAARVAAWVWSRMHAAIT
jgi:hypothetical protein